MLPEKMLRRRPKTDYPLLDKPKTVRVKFRKVGTLQYISHLDLQRTVSRVLTRAQIPMWYTKGFNPHAKVTFALPLSVGAQSECEYIDLRIERDMPCEDILQRLNGELTDEMRVLDVYDVPEGSDFQQIAWASYCMDIRCAQADAALAEQVTAYLTASPVLMDKKSKSGVRQVDITAMIRDLRAVCVTDGHVRLEAVLSASGAEYLNPEYVITALKQRFGILSTDLMTESYSIVRTRVLLSDGQTEFH